MPSDEVLADLEPLAQEKNIKLIGKCKDVNMVGSDILIYRLVYNLVENAIKYNHSGGQVIVEAYQKEKQVYLSVEDTGSGIPEELKVVLVLDLRLLMKLCGYTMVVLQSGLTHQEEQ